MKLLRRFRAFFRRNQLEAEMAEEMHAHLELQTAENIARGMPPEEARYAAMRTFGGTEQLKERCRDERTRGFVWFEQALQDLRYAMRSLRRNPGFSAVIVLTLALGIGGNATIFSVVNAVLLEPLPFAQLDRLVNLRETRPEAGGSGRRVPVPVSPATFFDWRNGVSSFAQIAAVSPFEATLTGSGEPEHLLGAAVTAELFPMFGVRPQLGRDFRPEENGAGAEPVVLLSHAFWQRRFGGDAAVVGRAMTLDGRPTTIVGVLPAWFDEAAASGISLRARPAIWTTLPLVEAGAARSVPAWDVHARLKPGVTLAGAQSEVSAVMQRLAREFPATNAARDAQVEPLVDRVVGEVRSGLWMLFAAVVLVLLIACANVANLLLARASLRGAETAMRAALGASRGRLIRQFLAESLLLSLGGCALGLAAAFASIDAFVALFPASATGIGPAVAGALPRAGSIDLDGRVLAFTVTLSLLTGVMFGLLPAWHAAKTDLQTAIQRGGRGGKGGPAAARVRSGLIVAQVALSVVLLVGAGLLIRSFAALNRVDPGFDPRNVLTLRLRLPGEKYQGGPVQAAFFDRVVQEVRAMPGVEAAALVFPLPFSGPIQNSPFAVPGRPANLADELSSQVNIVSPDYFRALGIRLTQGRTFSDQDRESVKPVVTINETLATRLWPGESALGKRLTVGRGRAATIEREVVGVFADIKQRELDSGPLFQICVPHAQVQTRSLFLAVRGRVDAATLQTPLRKQLERLDPDLPCSDVALWRDRIGGWMAPRRVTTFLLAAFAAVAFALASIGLYGVTSYMVAQRTREFGIRVALGANVNNVITLVVGQGLRLVALGLVIGVVFAVGSREVLSSRLFGVQALDLSTFAIVALLLTLVGVTACWLPARRAAKVDPMVVLRSE